jgi:glucose-1-phosphatase
MTTHGQMHEDSGKLVVFDLGGVVVRICRSWQEACNAVGIAYEPRAIRADLHDQRRALVRAYEVSAIESDEYFRQLSILTDNIYTPSEVQRVHEGWILSEYSGVAELIDDLHQAGVRTGVLSNTNASHWRQLTSGRHGPAKFPIVERAQHVHASHILKLAKPSKEIYQAFAEQTQTSPRDIVFFDDLAENVHGAKECCWHAHQIDHDGDTALQMRAELLRLGVLK